MKWIRLFEVHKNKKNWLNRWFLSSWNKRRVEIELMNLASTVGTVDYKRK